MSDRRATISACVSCTVPSTFMYSASIPFVPLANTTTLAELKSSNFVWTMAAITLRRFFFVNAKLLMELQHFDTKLKSKNRKQRNAHYYYERNEINHSQITFQFYRRKSVR